VLEGVNDHENLGAIFRNAAAFGVSAVLMDPTSADPLYRRSVRVSVGHVLSVPFARLAPWPHALAQLRDVGILVAALAPQPSPMTGLHPPPCSIASLGAHLRRRTVTAVAVLLGAEGAGLSPAALSSADVTVSIPMAPGVDSVNVATAAAIAFHELARDERTHGTHGIDGAVP
jgi:tRNA G18 (ribose-2'-O)-methylase SpoU